MANKDIRETVRRNLCLSCEACRFICPVNAIEMMFHKGQFLPEIISDKCTNCSLCLKICPGINLDPLKLFNFKSYLDIEKNGIIQCYEMYSKDEQVRKISTSGGIITTLVSELLKDKKYDGAFVLDYKDINNYPAYIKLIIDNRDIKSSTGSKYLPASIFNILDQIKKIKEKKSYIIVGTPCQIYTIINYLKGINKNKKLDLLYLGLFCDSTMNYDFLNFIKRIYENKDIKIKAFYYRSKEKYGWPGNSKILSEEGKKYLLSRGFRLLCKKYFRLNRCLYCYDKLNHLADVSFGDCYIKDGYDIKGKSNIIIRTEKGKRIFQEYSYLFQSKAEDFNNIVKSQKISLKNKILTYNNYLYHSYKKIGLVSLLKIRIKLFKANLFRKIGRKCKFLIIFEFYIIKILKSLKLLLK